MQRYPMAFSLIMVIGATFGAYAIADSLIPEFFALKTGRGRTQIFYLRLPAVMSVPSDRDKFPDWQSAAN